MERCSPPQTTGGLEERTCNKLTKRGPERRPGRTHFAEFLAAKKPMTAASFPILVYDIVVN